MSIQDILNHNETSAPVEFQVGEVEVYDSDDWEKRYFSLKQIIAVSDSDVEMLPLLRKALDDSNQSIRYLAANSLKSMQCKGVVDALLFALADSSDWIRIRAIEGLGNLRASEAVEPFIHYLDVDSNPKVRATIVKHLGQFKEQRLIPVIAGYLQDEDARVRANAIEGLGFYPPDQVEHIVRPFLEDGNARIRANVAIILSKSADVEVSRGTIASMLKSESPYERMGAVYSIGETGDPSYIPILIRLLNDSSYLIQRNVCDAMIKYGLVIQGPLLKEVRAQKSEQFITGALRVLSEVGDKKSLKTLLRLQEFGDGEVRAAAEEAIDKIYLRVDGHHKANI